MNTRHRETMPVGRASSRASFTHGSILERGCVAETSRSGPVCQGMLKLPPPSGFASPLRLVEDDTAALRSQSAFSLIEVMVAILILGIALVGLTQGITTALGSSKESELQTTAMLFAQGKIEELRASKLTVGEDGGDCGTGLEIYRWKQNVTTTDLDGLHDVVVTVESARTGQAICELQTLIFEVPVSREAAKSKDAKAVKKEGGGR